MKIDKFAGLQTVFNMSGKNPYKHDIGKCLSVFNKMIILSSLAGIMAAAGGITVIVSLLSIAYGVSAVKITSILAGFVFLAIAIKLIRIEYGRNVISVADHWKRVTSQLKNLGVNLSGVEHGNQVAAVFEARLVEIVSSKINAEKDGCDRKIVECDDLFKQVHKLAEDLALDVSTREDFFKGEGTVEFT
jgi:hypothetical protein